MEPIHTTAQAWPAADNEICRSWQYCSATAKGPSHQCDNAKTIWAWIIVSGTLNIQDIWNRLRINFWNTNWLDLVICFFYFAWLLKQICSFTTVSVIFEAWSWSFAHYPGELDQVWVMCQCWPPGGVSKKGKIFNVFRLITQLHTHTHITHHTPVLPPRVSVTNHIMGNGPSYT